MSNVLRNYIQPPRVRVDHIIELTARSRLRDGNWRSTWSFATPAAPGRGRWFPGTPFHRAADTSLTHQQPHALAPHIARQA